MAMQWNDYVSIYQPTGNVEAVQILRDRYDRNKSNHDLIRTLLGGMETAPKDAHWVTKAEDHINGLLTGIVNTGAYERADATMAEAEVFLNSDKGLRFAKQSMDARKAELKWQQEATRQGTVLDFGHETWENHQSYHIDEEGIEHENVYTGDSQLMGDYNGEMARILKTISPSYYGTTRGEADAIAKQLMQTYLGGPVGKQDLRRLTESCPQCEGLTQEQALDNIYQRLQGFTDQYIHTEQVTNMGNSGGMLPQKLSLTGRPLWDKNKMSTEGLITDLYSDPNNPDNLRAIEGNYKLLKGQLAASLREAGYSEAEIKKAQDHVFNMWGGQENRAFQLYTWSLANSAGSGWDPMSELTRLDRRLANKKRTAGLSIAGGGLGAGTAAIALSNPIGWAGLGLVALGAGIGMGIDYLIGLGDENVRDPLRHQEYDILWWNNESEQLQNIVSDIEKTNLRLGTDYVSNPNYDQLINTSMDYYAWLTKEGGDDVIRIWNEYEGGVMERPTYAPGIKNKDAITQINNYEERMVIEQFHLTGIPEGSPTWKTVQSNWSTMDVLGTMPPEFLYSDTPISADVYVTNKEGVQQRVEITSKLDAAGDSSLSVIENMALISGNADYVLGERVRLRLQQHKPGSINAQAIFEAYRDALLYDMTPGGLGSLYGISQLDQEQAEQLAQTYLTSTFSGANQDIVVQLIQNQEVGLGITPEQYYADQAKYEPLLNDLIWNYMKSTNHIYR